MRREPIDVYIVCLCNARTELDFLSVHARMRICVVKDDHMSTGELYATCRRSVRHEAHEDAFVRIEPVRNLLRRMKTCSCRVQTCSCGCIYAHVDVLVAMHPVLQKV